MNFIKHHHSLYLAPLALVITHLIWGASAPVFKWALEDIGPFSFAFLRFFLATLIILPFTIHQIRIRIADVPRIFLLAMIGFTLHISLLLVALQKTSSINAPIISAVAPIMIILASVVILKEKVRRKVMVGTIVSLVGVLIIILRPYFDHGLDGTFVGNTLLILSTFAFVAYTILLKEFKLKYSNTTLMFWMFAFGTLGFFPMFYMETFPSIMVPDLTVQSAFGILFGGIGTSVIAYAGYNYAIKHMKVNETGVFSYIEPIIAVMTAVPLLGESVTPSYLIGTLLVFAGIVLAEAKLHHHPKHN